MSTRTAVLQQQQQQQGVPSSPDQARPISHNGPFQDDSTQDMMLNLQQVLLLNSDPLSLLNSLEGDDYLEQLAPVLEDAVNVDQVDVLLDKLTAITDQKELEVQKLCNDNQQEYTKAVQQLAQVKSHSEQLRTKVYDINQDIQQTGNSLVAKNKMLLDSQGAKKSIDEATVALHKCLKVLNMTNRIYEMIEQKKYFLALKSITDLQRNYLQEVSEFEFARSIRNSVPAMQAKIKEDVIADLHVWLGSVRKISAQIGSIAFGATEFKRQRWKTRVDKNPHLRFYKLNSAVEIALEENDEFDPLDNDHLHVSLTPLFECMHIFLTLGVLEEFRQKYEHDRIKDLEVLLPAKLEFTDENINPLELLLHTVCGFAIVERATRRQAHNFRTAEAVDSLWQSACQRVADLIAPVLPNLQDPETILKVRTLLGLFIQTMESYEFEVNRLNSFLLTLFEKYSTFLKQRFMLEFQQTVTEDDYMPMVINGRELWENVISVSWYKSNVDPSHVKFPCTLPFSQVYPLSCAEIRNFVSQHYSFSDEYSDENPIKLEQTLKNSLDELLVDVVCRTLVDRLRSSNREEIVQIFVNLEYFETAAIELEKMLNESSAIPASLSQGPIKLRAGQEFATARKKAEKRVFELVNSKIDDFLEIADYNWEAVKENNDPSSYLIDMVRFLQTLVNSTLVNLPKSIKSFIYFDAFDHLATSLLDMLLNSGRRITRPALNNFDRDVEYLEGFVGSLGSGRNAEKRLNGNSTASTRLKHRSEEDADNSLLTTFTELRQTIELLQSPNMEEYNNTEIRMRKYGRVKHQNAIALIEKLNAAPPMPLRSKRLYRGRG
ncbi:exocyst complex subunit Sec15-like-domain-containing protein [Lipomyces japonicus]|uniref:exocyst complex subunit Sec15-like-domain-containing protein n=1 Tax=Lipomyces japonicus TaxID=56871 RepID=UPI0034CF6792